MRMLGWLLVAYAGIGLVIVLVAAVVGGPLIARVDRLATSAAGTMTAATQATDAAADAFVGFDASLAEADAAVGDAADLSREASVTLDGLAVAMSLSILGQQPLLPLAGQFETSADQLRALGGNLDAVGGALVGNRDDIAELGIRMRALADRMADLEDRIDDEQAARGLPLGWLFYGFLLWQLLPIAAAAIGGAWLLRHTRVVVDTPAGPRPG